MRDNNLQVNATKSIWSVPITVGALLLFTLLQITLQGVWNQPISFDLSSIPPHFSELPTMLLLTLFTLAAATLAHRLVDNFNLIRENSSLPFLFFVLMSLQFITPTTELGTGIAMLFSIGSYFFLFSSYGLNYSQRLLFNNALLISIASLFDLQLIFLLPLFAPALFLMRIVNFKNLLAILFGLIAPYVIVIPLAIRGNKAELWLEHFHQLFQFDWISPESLYSATAYNQLFTLLVVTSTLIGGLLTFQQDKVKSRSCYQFLIVVFYYAEFIRLSHYRDAEMFGWIANFAGALLLAHYFTLQRGKAQSILFTLILIGYLILASYPF